TDLPRRLFFWDFPPELKLGPTYGNRESPELDLGSTYRTRQENRKTMAAIPVGILGATGMVGQQFIALLANHPWFKVEWLGASQRSEGKAFRDAAAWRLSSPLDEAVARRTVEAAVPGKAPRLVFSGLDSSVAGEIERAFA